MAATHELLVTESSRGGYEVYNWAGGRERTLRQAPYALARGVRDLSAGIVDALALELVDPQTGAGEPPNPPPRTLTEIQATIADGSDAFVRLDHHSGRYAITPMGFNPTLREAAAQVAQFDPGLAFDLVRAADGTMAERVAARFRLARTDKVRAQALKGEGKKKEAFVQPLVGLDAAIQAVL